MNSGMGSENSKGYSTTVPGASNSGEIGTRDDVANDRGGSQPMPGRYALQKMACSSRMIAACNGVSSIATYLNANGYRMGRILGEGSYSKVKQCTRYNADGTPAARLACKMIDKTKASDDFVTKFLPRELDIIGKLQHPNIVKVFNVVEFDHHVYIFMDCCDRGDLLEYVKNRGQISENRSRHYFRQLLSATRYLHGQDIAHRDLKCENVLLGPGDIIKISDFGFSRFCRDERGRRILSKTYCGSAAYAAPEILQGTSYNPKLYDMWSLGCILFIMLTGHMPYDESNIPRMLQNQLDRALSFPSQVDQQLTEAAQNLLRRLLEPDVTRRATIDHAIMDEWTNYATRAPMNHDCYESGDTDPRIMPNENQTTPAAPMSYYGLPTRSEIFSKLIQGGPNHYPRYRSYSSSANTSAPQFDTPGSSTNPRPRVTLGAALLERQCKTQRSGTASSAQSSNPPKHRIPATARNQAGTNASQRTGTPRNTLITGVTQFMNSLTKGSGSPPTPPSQVESRKQDKKKQ